MLLAVAIIQSFIIIVTVALFLHENRNATNYYKHWAAYKRLSERQARKIARLEGASAPENREGA